MAEATPNKGAPMQTPVVQPLTPSQAAALKRCQTLTCAPASKAGGRS
jgi:hypothetical protein